MYPFCSTDPHIRVDLLPAPKFHMTILPPQQPHMCIFPACLYKYIYIYP